MARRVANPRLPFDRHPITEYRIPPEQEYFMDLLGMRAAILKARMWRFQRGGPFYNDDDDATWFAWLSSPAGARAEEAGRLPF